MYIHLITFEYYYKNDPQNVQEYTFMAPCATSSQARLYFWSHLCDIQEIQWDQVDDICIVLVRSKYIDTD